MVPQSLIVIFLITFFASLAFVYLIKNILIKANITDNPIVTEHKFKAGTPTMGGLGLLFALLFTFSLFFRHEYITPFSLLVLAAGLTGLLDDLIGLKVKEVQKIIKNISNESVKIGQLVLKPDEEARAATPKAKEEMISYISEGKLEIVGENPIKTEIDEKLKIIVQCLIGVFAVLTFSVSTFLSYDIGLFIIPVIIIAILGAINAVNLIDGMDGLASGILFIASISCIIFLYINNNIDKAAPFVILAALTLGFLFFNHYPAKIFMGDTGSFALGGGFAMAVLIADIPIFGVIALIVPIVSVIISLMHRANIFHLPVEPLHHSLNHWGMSEKKIVYSYWFLTLLSCIIALAFDYYIIL